MVIKISAYQNQGAVALLQPALRISLDEPGQARSEATWSSGGIAGGVEGSARERRVIDDR